MRNLSRCENFWIAGLVCATLGVLASTSRPVDAADYDAKAGATAISSAPAPIRAKLKAANGSRAKGSFTGILTGRKGQFAGSVQLPLASAGSGIMDASTAQTADLVLELTRQGMLYTRCDLLFTGLSKKSRVARFSVAVAKRKDALQQRTGFCELTVDPFGPGLPAPLARDTLTLKAIVGSEEHVLATGVFRR